MMAAVSYIPSEQHAFHFWETHHSKPRLAAPKVPHGFPEKLHSKLAWTRSEIEQKRSEWVLQLNECDIIALEAALASFEDQALDLSQISPSTFILPDGLALGLRKISDQVYNGIGFNIVRGLDPTRYTAEQNVAIYAGIAAHVAPQRGFLDRDAKRVLCHVVNATGQNVEETTLTHKRIPGFTNSPLSFHSDMCEIISLYALDIAQEGGRTLLSSAWQVYNRLAVTMPEVLQTLADDWVLDSFQDYSRFPPVTTPLLHSVLGEKVVWRFSRYPVTGFSARKRNPTLPAPTAAQIEAIDAVHLMAAKESIALPMEKGDMVFINDMAILHAREPFNEKGNYLQRHLLKFYLRDPKQTWPVPPIVANSLNKIYGPNSEGGIRKETWFVKYGPGQEDGWMSNG